MSVGIGDGRNLNSVTSDCGSGGDTGTAVVITGTDSGSGLSLETATSLSRLVNSGIPDCFVAFFKTFLASSFFASSSIFSGNGFPFSWSFEYHTVLPLLFFDSPFP